MTQAYTNLGGTGLRQGMFSLSGTWPLNASSTGRPFGRWLDGYPATFTNKCYMIAGVSTGTYLEVLCKGLPRIITGYKIYKDTPTCNITLDFEGWNGASWVSLSTGVSLAATSPITASFTNTTAYQKYRFKDTSGTWATVQFAQIEFEIDGGGGDRQGNRTSTITATSTFTGAASTAPSNFVDGGILHSASDAWWPSTAEATSGKEIKFQFITPRCLKAAFLESDEQTLTAGVYKWQSSDDGSTWTDIGSSFTLTLTAANNPTIGDLSSNTDAHTYYRLLGVSGNMNTTPYYIETLFDIAPGPELGAAVGLQNWSTASSKTIAITTTQDNSIIVLAAAFEQSTGSTLSVSSVTDTAGLTWALRKAVPFTSSDGRKNALETWWAKKPTAGATTITVTANVSIDDGCIMVAEFMGLPDPDDPWDANASVPASTTNTTATNTAPSATVTTDNRPIILTFSGTQFTSAQPTGFTQIGSASNVGGASAQRLVMAYKIDYAGPQTSLAVTGSAAINNNDWIVDALKFAVSASGVTGTLAATEGPDTAAFAGYPGVLGSTGTLAATESPDTAAFAGYPHIVGTLAATESPDTAAFAGYPQIVGALHSTEAPDILSAYGWLPISAVLSSTEAPDVFQGEGTSGLGVAGTFAATEAPDVMVFAGSLASVATRRRQFFVT